jgi:hypothetical protein
MGTVDSWIVWLLARPGTVPARFGRQGDSEDTGADISESGKSGGTAPG